MINAKLIYKNCLELPREFDQNAYKEWLKVCKIELEDDLWDALIIGLCLKGKGESLTQEELDRLYLMLDDCHN